MKRIIATVLCLLLAVSVLTACGSDDKSETTDQSNNATSETTTVKATETSTEETTEAPVEKGDFSMVLEGSITDLNQIPAQDLSAVNADYQAKAPEAGEVVAVIHTNYGDMKMRFFPEAAPAAVNNFIALAKAGKYDNTIIHRIFHPATAGISGIQGGDYTRFNGTGGASIYGDSFGLELSPYLSNTRGSVAMANTGRPNSNGSQFYVNQGDNSVLDGGYTIFGQVYEGLDVLDAIYAVETEADRPVTQVDVTGIEITTY